MCIWLQNKLCYLSFSPSTLKITCHMPISRILLAIILNFLSYCEYCNILANGILNIAKQLSPTVTLGLLSRGQCTKHTIVKHIQMAQAETIQDKLITNLHREILMWKKLNTQAREWNNLPQPQQLQKYDITNHRSLGAIHKNQQYMSLEKKTLFLFSNTKVSYATNSFGKYIFAWTVCWANVTCTSNCCLPNIT